MYHKLFYRAQDTNVRSAIQCISKLYSIHVEESGSQLGVYADTLMNPDVLEGWKCEGKKKLTTDMIMEWAGAWEKAPSAPQFTVTRRVDKADV